MNLKSFTNKPFLIAEISGNHGGNLDQMLELIGKASSSGADAVKFQYFDPYSMVQNSRDDDYVIKEGTWKGRSLIDIYKEGAVPKEWLNSLFTYANVNKIKLFSSVFDLNSLNDLELFDPPFYKIASNELEDVRLVNEVIKLGKPIILSTGAADEDLLNKIIKPLSANEKENITVLHCVSQYPAPVESSNINLIPQICERYGVKVGLSDHSIGHIVACAAVCLGASTIEKHFTLDRYDGGLDSSFSSTPEEFRTLRQNIDETFESLGVNRQEVANYKENPNIFTRQIWVRPGLKKGKKIISSDLITYRTPQSASGIMARNIYEVIGRRLSRSFDTEHILKWKDIEE